MKIISILIFIMILYYQTQGQNVNVPFLTVQQSAKFQGAGQIGTAISSDDALGFYLNPAQLGNFSKENNFSIYLMPQKSF